MPSDSLSQNNFFGVLLNVLRTTSRNWNLPFSYTFLIRREYQTSSFSFLWNQTAFEIWKSLEIQAPAIQISQDQAQFHNNTLQHGAQPLR